MNLQHVQVHQMVLIIKKAGCQEKIADVIILKAVG
jgi:hypothetical protein